MTSTTATPQQQLQQKKPIRVFIVDDNPL